MRKIAYITLAVGLAGIVAAACTQRIKSQDEGPIIVQNGSMKITTTEGGKWEDDGGHGRAWKNTTVGKVHEGDLWVRVDLTDGTHCKGQKPGHSVHVEYTGNFKAHFNVVAGGSSPYTNVEPKGQLDFKSNTVVEHASNGPHDHIEAVKIGSDSLNCNITETNLKSVNICSSGTRAECQ